MMRPVVVRSIINFTIVTPLSMKMPRKNNNTSQKNILVTQEENKQNEYKEGKF